MIAVFSLAIMANLAFAAEDGNVAYAGGTVPLMKGGATGKFDFTSANQLQFISSGMVLEIPYSSIESFQHTKEAVVHLGVAPAIAVGLLAARRHNHFVRITYKDNNQLPQVVVFLVPKSMTAYLMPILQVRSPQARCWPLEDCMSKPIARRSPALAAGVPTRQLAESK